MPGILDRFNQNKYPADLDQYTAFQIAHKFNDLSNIGNYFAAARKHSAAVLIKTYRATLQQRGSELHFFENLDCI
jgi:hypothetical protein